MAAFTVPIFPTPESGFAGLGDDLVKNALQSYGQTKYGFPKEAADLEIAKLKPEAMRTQMQLQKAQADKANAIMGLITQYLGGSEGRGQGSGQSAPAIPNQGGMPSFGSNMSSQGSSQDQAISNELGSNNQQEMGGSNEAPQAPQAPSMPSSNKDLARESFISHLLGFGNNQIVDVNGSKYALTGTGKLFSVAQGMTPYQEGLQKGLGKFAAESYGQSVNNVVGLQNRGFALDEMINSVNSNPEFFNVVGPVQSFLTKWAGNPEQQKLLGSLQSSSGEIKLQVAPYLKGAFTGKTQSMIEEVKANPNVDFPHVFIGKLRAQKLIDSAVSQIDSLRSEYIAKGMLPNEATKKAVRQVNLDKLRPVIDNLLDPIITIENEKGEQKQVKLSQAQKLIGKK